VARAFSEGDFGLNSPSTVQSMLEIERRVEEARQRGSTADARADQRKQERERQADARGEEGRRRDAGFEATLEQLGQDAARARERALGEKKAKPDDAKDAEADPLKPRLPKAPPGAFMPPKDTKGEKDKGLAGAGNWSGVGLDIGPEISKLEDPAKRTANATERAADAVDAMAQRQIEPDPAAAPLQAAAGVAPGDFQAGLDAVAMAGADPDVSAEQLLGMFGGGAPAAPQMGAQQAVAMEAVAPKAAAGQQAAAQGVQAATDTSQIGVAFQQFSSKIVDAINAGNQVSRAMLNVLHNISDKKPAEALFQ